ncbi:MAG: response regulator transcription factor [Deltaproteobacteria bacterium]|nr:response regulator transcription factor [Deltaproteobacteria bacterium]
MARLLVIEDDRAIALGVRLNLRKEGHEVELAADGDEGLARALSFNPDLIVLDVMMPGKNGYEVLRELRHKGSTAGVLMLTAKGTESDKILGLKLGADDYLAKPFGLGELLARVEALLRRRPPDPRQKDQLRFGDVELDLGSQTARRAGQPIELTAQEFKVLKLFVTSEGRALSREEILARCWGAEYEGTPRTVDNFIRALRVKLEADAEAPRHLVTVRGHGYRFER